MVMGTYVYINQGSARSQRFQTLRTLLFASKSRMAQGVDKLLDVGSLFRRFLHFASVQTLELGKFLPCTLGGTRADERLSEPVVDGRGVTVNLKGLFILGDSVVVLVFVRIKDAELEIRIGVPRIERDGGLEQRLYLRPFCRLWLDLTLLPQSHCVVVTDRGIVRPSFEESMQPGPDLVSYRGQEVLVGLAKKDERQGIGSIHVRGLEESFGAVVEMAEAVKRDTQADFQAGRTRVAGYAALKNLNRGSKGLMQQQFPTPIENIALARVHVRGLFELGHRDQIVFGPLFNLSEETVKLRRIVDLKELFHLASGFIKVARLFVGQGKVVSVVVGAGIRFLGALKIRERFRQLVVLDVKLSQVMVGIVASRFELDNLAEFRFRFRVLMEAHQVGGERGTSGRRTWMQSHRPQKIGMRLLILAKRHIDQSCQFIDFEAGGVGFEEGDKLPLCVAVALGLVGSDGGLKLACRLFTGLAGFF